MRLGLRYFVNSTAPRRWINREHLGLRTAFGALRVLLDNLMRGQTNFARMLWRFNRVYNPERQIADHHPTVRYELSLP
jgi:hopanoid C-3 methylase